MEQNEYTIERNDSDFLARHKKTKAWGLGKTKEEAISDMIKCIDDTNAIMTEYGIVLIE